MAHQGSEFTGSQVMQPPGADGYDGSRALVAAPAAPIGGAVPGFAPRGPEILVGGFNQTWLMNCLRRRWLMATLMGLFIGLLVGGFLMWLFPESSQTTAYLTVDDGSEDSPFEDTRRQLNHIEVERQANATAALIKSQQVLQDALIRDEIAKLDAVQYHKGEELLWLLEDLKVSFVGESPVLEVKYEGEEDPEDMKKIVDAVVDVYMNTVLFEERLEKRATQDDLRRVLEGVKTERKEKLEELNRLATLAGGGGALNFEEFELPTLRQNIAMYQSNLFNLERELAELEAFWLQARESAYSPAAMESAVAAVMEKDQSIAMYQAQLFELNQQIQLMEASTKNPNNTTLKRLRQQYAYTEQAMKTYEASAQEEARKKLRSLPNEALRSAYAEYTIRKQSAEERKAQFEADLKKANDRISEMAAGDPELLMLQSDIDAQEALALELDQKIQEWRVMQEAEERSIGDGNSGFEKVKITQSAFATEQINYYERWAIAGIGGLAAMALTCYGVALLEFRKRRLNGPNDIDEGLGIRVLGVLPPASLKALTGNSLVATQVAEAIDNVRATIMHDSTSRPRQVVMVTSPATMEGSTTVAASLALSLARAGRRTLLVDADLRAPALHKLFGLPLEDGLSEVLRAEVDLADAVRPTNSEGLHLLTAGVCDMDAVHALATDQPQPIFDKLRDQFDFVVIDAPPVLGISDALSLGQYVDGAVLTVLRDHSEIRRICQSIEILRGMGVRVIGSVVNGVPCKADRRVVRLHQASSSRVPRLPATAAVDVAEADEA
jgi:succinoglycan biosynthesis transport protein ExoP